MEPQENKAENQGIGQESAKETPNAESTAKTPNPGKTAASGIPLYLVVLIAILALFVGFSLNILLAEPAPEPIGECEVSTLGPLIKTKFIYSDDCPACLETNTLLLSFDARDINYSVERIEVSSPEGKKLIAQYGIKVIPAVLIDVKNVSEYWLLEESLSKIYPVAGDYFIVGESNLDPQTAVPKMDLIKSDESCSAETPNMILFDDPYDFTSITHNPEVIAFNEAFGDEVGFEFNYFPTKTIEVRQKYGIDAELAVDNIICAQEQGKYFEFKKAVMDVFCDENNDGQTTSEEYAYCANPALFFYPTYDEPLHASDIDKVAAMVEDLDLNAMASCLQSVDEKKAKMLAKAELYGINTVPAAIYNCQYRLYTKRDRAEEASLVDLGFAVCKTTPTLSTC